MKPSVYIESTIPSYLGARRSRDLLVAAAQEATEMWWNNERHNFRLFISVPVLDEIRLGDPVFAGVRLAVVHGITILPVKPQVGELAKRLVAQAIIPAHVPDDALHVAYAAAHKIDYLLTWNCRHINNPVLRRRIEQACLDCGLICPVICTPAELMRML